MGMDPRQAVRKIDTSTLAAAGLLNPEQSREFWRQVFLSTPFSEAHRKEGRRAKTGEIDKIGIASRILRKKTEGTDDGYRATVTPSKVEYATQAVRLPWEATEETFRENIEEEGFEDTLMALMTKQVGVDLEDLHWNGDSEVGMEDPDHDFLYINDGWWKQISALASGAHAVDASTYNGGIIAKAHFFALYNAIPAKYRRNTQELRWMMNDATYMKWVEYMTDRATAAGDAAVLGGAAGLSAGGEITVQKPLGIPILPVGSLDDGKIVLSYPRNFISVYTYETKVRKTTEGKTAIMEDKRFYVIHFDDDPVIEEMDAVAYTTCLLASE